MAIKTSKIDWSCMAVAFALFVLSYPYFFWGILSNIVLVTVIKIIVALFVLLKFCKHLSSQDKRLVLLYVIVVFLYCFLNLFQHGGGIGVLLQLPNCLFIVFCLIKDEPMKKIGLYFTSLCSVVIGIGLFFFLLTFFGASDFSLGTVVHFAQDRLYSLHPLYVREMESYDYYRFNSVFDEPGALGTLCVFLLFLLKYNFKDWRTWICFLAGVFSFSFYFYGMLLVYWLFRVFTMKKNGLLTILLSTMLLSGFYFSTRNNPMMYTMIWERFEWDSQKGGFKGDDRMNESGEIAYQKLKGTNEYWLGLEGQNVERFINQVDHSSSYKLVVASNGMIFFALYVLFFLILGWQHKGSKMEFLLYSVLVMLCFYQRTNIFSIIYLFLFTYIARQHELEENPIAL